MVEQAHYEVRVRGRIGPAAIAAFSDMSIHVESPVTVLSGPLEQEALHDLLNRLHALGFTIAEVHQVPAASTPD